MNSLRLVAARFRPFAPSARLASFLGLVIALAALASFALADAPPTIARAPAPHANATPNLGLGAPTTAPAPTEATATALDDARFDSDSSLLAHADDVVDYAMRASLDPIKHTVHGEGTITWRNTSTTAVKELWVHLYLNAFKNQRSVWLSETTGGFRGTRPVEDWGTIDVRKFALRDEGGITTDLWANAELHRPSPQGWGEDDETDAHVPLPREVAPGEKIQIDMVWDDKMPSVIERTGYLGKFHMIAQWFPKIARLEPDGKWAHFPFHHFAEFYADYGTYDVTLDVPQGYVIGATGPAIDTRNEAGRKVERHVQGDIHDFAWTAWDEWQIDKDVIGGVSVSVLYPPSFKADAQRELRTMRFALPDFGARYGRYPYEVLTLVHPPSRAAEAGGMEYPTLITTGGPWYGPPGIYEVEITALHEFGHQYFYGLIGTNEVEWPFLDEGLNSYAEAVAMTSWLGPASAADLFGLGLSDHTIQSIASNATGHDAPVAQPSYAFQTGNDYGGLVYMRTATILETIRRTYGEALVDRALGRYARKYRFGHPVPEDLIAVFHEVMGERVAQTLRTALFEEGWVDYVAAEISSARAKEPAGIFDRGGKRETAPPKLTNGYDGWALVQRRGTLSFPVEIDLVREDGGKQRVHWDGDGREIRIPYHGDVPLRSVLVDPEDRVSLDEKLTNNFATAPGEPHAGAPRTFERVLYWAELGLQAVLP